MTPLFLALQFLEGGRDTGITWRPRNLPPAGLHHDLLVTRPPVSLNPCTFIAGRPPSFLAQPLAERTWIVAKPSALGGPENLQGQLPIRCDDSPRIGPSH